MSDQIPSKKTTTDPVQAKIAEVGRLSRQIMAAPASKALDTILDYPQPAALVHAFPEQDFHLLVREIGVNDALLLLKQASNRQWEYLLDVEVWARDRIDLEALSRWAHLLMSVDSRRLVDWASSEKWRLFECLFHKEIDVVMLEENDDPSDLDDNFFSIDGTFYVRLRPLSQDLAIDDKEAIEAFLKNRQQFVRSFLTRLAENDYPRYQTFLLESAGLILAEQEEETYRLRNVRLAEKGFLPFDEAVGVYQHLDLEDLKTRDKKLPTDQQGEGRQTPHFVHNVPDGAAPWAHAVTLLDDDLLRQSVAQEMAALVNQLVMADQQKIQSRDDLQQVMDKANGYVQIALERLAQKEGVDENQPVHMRRYISQYALYDLFRLGFSQVLQIKWRADKWRIKAWFRTQKLPLSFWGQQWMGTVGGLLLKKPRYFNDRPDALYTEFSALNEVTETELILEQVMAMDTLFSQLKLPVKGPRSTLLTWKNLLLTMWCRQMLNLPNRLASVSLKQFRPIFETELMRVTNGIGHVRKSAKQHFITWLSDRSGWAPDTIRDTVGISLDSLFSRVEEQLGSVRPEHLDSKYIDLFILRS